MWYEAFKGVAVVEPPPGPVNVAQVEKDLAEVWAILEAARIKLGMAPLKR